MFPRWLSGKESTSQVGDAGVDPWVRKISGRRNWQSTPIFLGFPGDSESKESTCNGGDLVLVGKIPWRRDWQPTVVFLPGNGQKEPWRLQCIGSQKSQTQLNN